MKTNEDIAHIKEEQGIYYIQRKYINREFYTKKLQMLFPDQKIYNISDFNETTCFTYFIPLGKDMVIGTDSFEEYIISNNEILYYAEILISTISPIIAVHFFKYSKDGDELKVESKDLPFEDEHKYIFEKIDLFAQKNRLSLIDDIGLKEYMSSVDQTVFCNYFNQAEADFPYKK